MKSLLPIPSGSRDTSLQAPIIAFCIACVIFAWAPDSCYAQPQDRAELVAALDSAAQVHVADSTVAGVSVAVTRGGETLLHEGYGQADVELDVPMPRDAVFEIGSITKQFTAAAILQLAAKDSVDLDSSVTEYLPAYDTRGHRVTVRHLLYHTSGLRDYTTLSEFQTLRHRTLPQDTVLSLVEREPFRFAPGSAMNYSNTGYYLLGQIAEAVSGQSYAEYLQDHVLTPAGMENTFHCDERAVVDGRAHGYSWTRRGFRLRERGSHSTWSYAAGGLCSTTGDLVAWNRALHGGEVLPDSLYEEMVAPGRLADGTTLRYGMGLYVPMDDGHRVIGHLGGLAGFVSASLYYPEADVTVVVCQNTWGPRAAWDLADALADLTLGSGAEPDVQPYEGDLSTFEGRYAGPVRAGRHLTLRIRATDGHLLASETGGGASPDTLQHVSGLTWEGESTPVRLGTDRYRFVRAGGRTIELRLDEAMGHYVLRRVGAP